MLIIAALMNHESLSSLLAVCEDHKLDVLVEVHTKEELKLVLDTQAQIIGINNRDLNDFTVDLATTEQLRPLVPPDRIVVSESGIKGRNDMVRLESCGVNAVLIGESLMTAPDISIKMKELLMP